MNVLVTGGNGQLGQSINKAAHDFPLLNMLFTDVDTLDITNADQVSSYVGENDISAIINCAAYTAVDKAEDDQDLAFLINQTGPDVLSRIAATLNISLIHISTDYVFDGKYFRPYTEEHKTNPASVYGKSKEAGEKAVLNNNPNGWIIRTSWLYSEFGQNFVKTMIRLGGERNELKVISDQIGSPTYAPDLAGLILSLLQQLEENTLELKGIELIHFTNAGICSWYDFAISIMHLAAINCTIIPIPTEAYPLPAPRPFYSVLSTDKVRSWYVKDIPHWQASLRSCVENLKN